MHSHIWQLSAHPILPSCAFETYFTVKMTPEYDYFHLKITTTA